MASRKATIKGRGPELFGRGVDLLFGADQETAQFASAAEQPSAPASANGAGAAPAVSSAGAAMPPREAAYLDAGPTVAASMVVDEYLRRAAEAFFGAAQYGAIGSVHPVAAPEEPAIVSDDSGLAANQPEAIAQPPEPGLPDSTPELISLLPPVSGQVSVSAPASVPAQAEKPEPAPVPGTAALAHQEDNEGDIMPEPILDNQVEEIEPGQTTTPASGRKVGPPPANGKGEVDESMLSDSISTALGTLLTKQEVREILGKLSRRDLNALDKEIDALYEKVSTLLSGNRKEATIAFDILRKARLMLLKDPEHFADAEYLVRQVRARMNQIEQSLEGGRTYAPRIFAYQAIWMLALGLLALVTTLGGTTFSAWVSYLLGIPLDSERLNWTVLFISTLAWGGIGGVTSALWSLYHHISVQRDYDPVENLWYYSQPVLGMVLGGIVFLVMGSGFLVVQVNLAAQDAALGARLLPAAIAVVAGFRQNMVLDLMERIIALIMPGQAEEKPALQSSLPTPPEEPAI